MVVIIGLAVGLMIAGLVMCYLSGSLRGVILQAVAYWTGIVLFVVGFILLVAPVIVWLSNQIKAMLLM